MVETQAGGRRPFDGLKVLSFELQVAGPYCTMMLADQGADVIKVERPDGGDTARGGAPMLTNEDGERQSGYFLRFNRNKRSITLDLKTDEGRGVFLRLAAQSDVVVENYRPGLLNGLGLGYDVVSELNPRIIYASISGFGSLPEYEGPYSRRPAYDIVAQAMGGLMNTCGQAGGPPTWLGVAVGDVVSGMNAAHAISVALYDRERSGRGRYLDVAMYDSMVALAERSITAYSLTGQVLERGVEPYMAPWGPFETSDGWVSLIVATERDWAKFCTAIERPELVGVDGTRSGPERAASMAGWLGKEIGSWFADRSSAEGHRQCAQYPANSVHKPNTTLPPALHNRSEPGGCDSPPFEPKDWHRRHPVHPHHAVPGLRPCTLLGRDRNLLPADDGQNRTGPLILCVRTIRRQPRCERPW